ncbi:MAG: exodeoxyribonuclease VII large subunit [Oleiphilaceae bacterium]|nr:exodeoxyribonuclease VII large subunit [Oleiphilaceae bacterium]
MPPATITTPQALSVSELNRQVKRLLEVSYRQVWVKGELSSFSRPSSGHWYFSLKDERAQIRCAMFRGFNQNLRFVPKEGDEVLVRAKVSLYEGRGDYQLIVEGLEPAGLGQLQAAFEALKLKLAAEGLFDERHKQPLPRMPLRIGVITSATGAVIHDILSVTQRRFPLAEIRLVAVPVQGDGAAQTIARAIQLANEEALADVLIVGRGGGSLEDLWAFNEEIVARAIHASTLPVVSAVGHETDFTIADLVADYRAPTPSAAAEKLTPDQYEIMQWLDQLQHRLQHHLQLRLRTLTERIADLNTRIKAPDQSLHERQQRVTELYLRCTQAIQHRLQQTRQTTQQAKLRLANQHPERQLKESEQRFYVLFERLKQKQQQILDSHQHRLALLAQTLNLTSPLATLGRGYAIVGNHEHRALKQAEQVAEGSRITATLAKGRLHCVVESVDSEYQPASMPEGKVD